MGILRSLRRNVVKNRMRKAGLHRFCKKDEIKEKDATKTSYFAKKWRQY